MKRLFSTSIGRLQKLNHAAAPTPSSLPKSRAKMGKWKRRGIVLGGAGLVFYGWDSYFNSYAILRATRCVKDLIWVGLDYKINFTEGRDIEALHERSAERIYNLMIKNKGLYIKMGQAVAIQANAFPIQFQEKLSQLFDSAPQDSWAEVEKLLKSEYNDNVANIFEYIDKRAIASASIAQVHRAKLRSTGEWVALKVQHTDLAPQVGWDLMAYRWIMWIYDRYLFKMPIYHLAEHVADRLLQEVDFQNEMVNAEATRNNVLNDKTLRKHIYVPQNYAGLSTKRVMVTEWIDGVPISNKKDVHRFGFDTGSLMKWLIKLYSKQIYDWGWVHCDPHPGNVLLRYVNGKQQNVLIDHGLYIREDDDFRRNYCSFWEAMFSGDMDTMKKVSQAWGFGDSEMLASATLMQSYKTIKPDSSNELSAKEEFSQHEEMREKFREFLKNAEQIPLELVFLGRTMRIIQGLNRRFGSPVNRIKEFALEASKSNFHVEKKKGYLSAWKHYLVFSFTMLMSDLAFFYFRVRQFILGSSSKGVEDYIDEQMKFAAKEMGFQYEDDPERLLA